MEFGAQRGKLLYDLALELGSVPTVREAIQAEFERRGHTWTVAVWADDFRDALDRPPDEFEQSDMFLL